MSEQDEHDGEDRTSRVNNRPEDDLAPPPAIKTQGTEKTIKIV